ncbi:autophagy-related protein 16-1-like [Elysia marginata]|uniref:Autophagy-related protein 16-1-like n=1 Tax=Elysia marginata TaxID=1093978 RepID=A0AAV4F1N6_9GAST|nr:autophagy-related protein 16-1-like [Elysia marginata]
MAASIDWKLLIRQQIQHRNHKQCQPFTSLIQTNNRLQEIASNLQSKNVQLQVEIERMREDGHSHHDGRRKGHQTESLERSLDLRCQPRRSLDLRCQPRRSLDLRCQPRRSLDLRSREVPASAISCPEVPVSAIS